MPPGSNQRAIFVHFLMLDFFYQKIPLHPRETHTYMVTWLFCKGNLFPEMVWTVLLVPAGRKKRAILVPIFTPDFPCQTIPLHLLSPRNSYFATVVRKWVEDSIKSILLDNCQAYLSSNDMGKQKIQTLLINEVAQKIGDVTPRSDLPNNLNKVLQIVLLEG